jgi:hypothetical protein
MGRWLGVGGEQDREGVMIFLCAFRNIYLILGK